MRPPKNPWLKTASLLALVLVCSQSWAQYVWTDEKGVRQYSDQPPPASVPDSRIIKGNKSGGLSGTAGSPGGSNPTPPATSSAASNTAPNAPTLAERNAEFNKRRTAKAEADKKEAEQTRLAEQKKVNCERAASYKRTLESGARMARIDANGERVFPTEEERSRDLREASRTLEDCKG